MQSSISLGHGYTCELSEISQGLPADALELKAPRRSQAELEALGQLGAGPVRRVLPLTS